MSKKAVLSGTLADDVETNDPLVRPNLEPELAELKTKTAAMVATALPRLAALPSQERLVANPEIWRVAGA